VVAEGHGVPVFRDVDAALARPGSQLRLFGKPRVEGERRVAVTLASGEDVEQAREYAREAAAHLHVELR
jgi:phosphoribosylglycinamide formyltransferase 2